MLIEDGPGIQEPGPLRLKRFLLAGAPLAVRLSLARREQDLEPTNSEISLLSNQQGKNKPERSVFLKEQALSLAPPGLHQPFASHNRKNWQRIAEAYHHHAFRSGTT